MTGKDGSEGGRPGATLAAAEASYFLTPRSVSASLAFAIDSLCLPPSWSFCASSSLATAPLTFGSSAFILAAASRPSLMSLGQELASATPPVNARVTATAVATIAFFISSPHVCVVALRSSALAQSNPAGAASVPRPEPAGRVRRPGPGGPTPVLSHGSGRESAGQVWGSPSGPP